MITGAHHTQSDNMPQQSSGAARLLPQIRVSNKSELVAFDYTGLSGDGGNHKTP